MILYSVPSRTGVTIQPKTVAELAKYDFVQGIKEATGNISTVAEIAALCGEDFAIYSGNDDQILPLLSLGGKGVISVLSNVAPKQTHDMVRLYLDGHREEALHIQLDFLPLIKALFCEVNPIPVKAALNLMGMEAGPCRLPLTTLEEDHVALLKQALINAKIIG